VRSFPDERRNPGFLLPDREMLETWLDLRRAWLLGLVRHLVEVERNGHADLLRELVDRQTGE
jgi:hypothetical protein